MQQQTLKNPFKALDFSNYFLQAKGLDKVVFEINQLEPRIIEFKGEFCLGDCYLILNSFKRDEQVFNVIYTWIGSVAQLDKRFCCAMYAVGLKEFLNGNSQIIKVGPHEESLGFKDLFPDLKYLEETQSTESGLFPVQEKNWNLLLYKVHDWALVNVEPVYTTLSKSSVFILDNGLEIFQWNGKESSKQQRLKGKIICNRICGNERKGRARVIAQDQGQEHIRFWNLLGFSDEHSFEPQAHQSMDDWKGPVLYKYVCFLKFRVPEGLDGNPLYDVVDTKNLKKALLDSMHCFIMDAGSLLIIWIGKCASHQTKAMATEYLTKIVPLQPRPRWIHVDRCIQDHESEVFKLYFRDWDEYKSFGKEVQINQGIHMDTDAFFNVGRAFKRDNSFLIGTLTSLNSLLVKMSVFVHANGKFITVPAEEVGVLYLKEAYVFLCVYKVIDNANELQEICEKKIQDSALECVLYFWKGRNAARRAFATFRFKTQPELEELVKSLYGCEMSVVHVEHGKEPLILLSHISNQVVYEKGFRNQRDPTERALYRIRIDSKYGTMRAYNISIPAPYLVNSDSYFVIHNHKANLIKSCTISQTELSNLYQMCRSILAQRNLSDMSIISLDNTLPLDDGSIFKVTKPFTDQFLQPIFFRCSCALGYYSIEHLVVFSQEDLRPDCVIILDCRPGPFFMWRGREASDVVTQLTFRAIDQKKILNEETEDCNIIGIEQGKEPEDFMIYFNVWEDDIEPEPTNSYLIKMKELKI